MKKGGEVLSKAFRKKDGAKIMKLIDLILNYKYLYNNTVGTVETTRYAVSKSEVQNVTVRIRSNVEKRKKELSELREISNQLFSENKIIGRTFLRDKFKMV